MGDHVGGGIRRFAVAAAVGIGLLAGPTAAVVVVPAAPAAADTTSIFKGPYERITKTSSGANLDGGSSKPFQSGDGRFVTFASRASNLVPGDTNSGYDFFLHDRWAGVTERVNVSSSGAQADVSANPNGYSPPSVSDDGRYVVFASSSPNLVGGDTNGIHDVFLRDRSAGTTVRLSRTSTGEQLTRSSGYAMISADGSKVVFTTSAALIPEDTDTSFDVYDVDTATGAIVLVSPGFVGNADGARMSGNGRFVAFVASAKIYLRDLQMGTTTLLLSSQTGGFIDAVVEIAGVSDGGTRLVFESGATNIVANDPDGNDAYLLDKAAGSTVRLTDTAGTEQAQAVTLSRDGSTLAYNMYNQPLRVVRIDAAETITIAAPNGATNILPSDPMLSSDGGILVLSAGSSSMTPGYISPRYDVFVARLDSADLLAPTVLCDAADGQWHADDVMVSCTASDAGSGLAVPANASFQVWTAVAAGTVSGNAATSTRNVCDVVGNCRTASSTGHKVDRTNPTATVDAASKGTFVQGADVPAVFSCDDTGSGVTTCAAEAAGAALTTSDPLPTAAPVTSTIEITATDGVGHTSTATAPFVVTDDLLTGTVARPSGTPVPDAVVSLWPVGAEEPSAWTTTEADGTYRFSISDSEHGTFAIEVTKDGYDDAWAGGEDRETADPVVLGVRPASADVTLTPTPVADVTAPEFDCDGLPTAAVHDDNATVLCSASDDVALANPADSGFALSTEVAAGAETLVAMTPVKVVCDTSENCTSAGPFGPFEVDRKAPVVSINFPSEGQSFPLGATINGTDFGCTDLFLVKCTSSVVGSNLPATAGAHSFTVTGTDAAGHATSVTRTYNVQTTTLRGLVYTDPNGDFPLPGALVELWAPTAPRTGPPTATATTTPNGSWSVSGLVPDMPYFVRYSKTGYATTWHGGAATPETSQAISGPAPISSQFFIVLKPSDTTGPTVSCTPPTTATWRTTAAVVVPCTASDPSGLASGSPSSFTLGVAGVAGQETSNASTDSRSVCDIRGNCTTAGPYSGYKFDRKAPTFSCPTPSPLWSNAERVYSCPTADGGIGGQIPGMTLGTSVGPGNWNASAFTNSINMCDSLGNCAIAQLSGLKVDRAAPTSTCSTPPTTWQSNNVTITCTPTDSGSGYTGAATVPAFSSVGAGQESASATAATPPICDAVNNCATRGFPGLKIDRKGPVVSCAGPSSAWQNANVSLSCSHSDGGAGLPTTYLPFPGWPFGEVPYPLTFTASTNAAAGTESASVAATATQKCDLVNNCTTVSITGNKIDRKAPALGSCTAPSNTPWYATNVTATCAAADGGSGTDQATFVLATPVGAGQSFSSVYMNPVNVCDRVANCVSTYGPNVPWKVDRAAPSAVCPGHPAAGSMLDHDLTFNCTAADYGGSGLAPSTPPSFVLATSVGSGNEAKGFSTESRVLCDLVNNCGTIGAWGPFDIDRKDPVVSVTTPTTSPYVQFGTPLVADYECTDLFLVTCTAPTPDGEALPGSLGAHSFTVTATDQVGHTTTVDRSYTVLPADAAPPTVLCTPPSASVANAWRATQMTINCTSTDASPLGTPSQAAFTLSTTVAAGAESAAATIPPVQVCDVFGHCTNTNTYGPYKVDRNAPNVPCTNAPTGWIKTNASLVCTPSDGGSGATSNSVFNLATTVATGAWDGDASTVKRTLCDKVGNCTTVGADHLQIDRAGPVVTCGTAPTTWSKDNLSVNCTAADPGVGYTGTAPLRAVSALPAGQESADAPGSVIVCDTLGNCTTKVVNGFKIDRKAPAFTCQQADGLWHNDNLTLPCEQIDAGSGLASTSPAAGARDFTVSTAISPGNYHTNAPARNGNSCDLVGNCVLPTVNGNKIDRKAPTATCPAGDAAWHGENITVNCTVVDIGSGPVSPQMLLSTTVEAGAQSDAAATEKGTFCDLAANCVQMVAPGRYKIDRKAPKVTVTAPNEGAARVIGSTFTVAYTCTDEGAGLAGCTGPLAPGATLTATVLGPQTFAVEGVDLVGNRATTTVTWRSVEAIAGRVVDPSGNGIEGVVVSRYAATGTAPAIDSVTTDADGRFVFESVNPGSYRFGATKPGDYLPRFFGSSTLAGTPPVTVDGITQRVLSTLTLTPASSIGGTVTSSATGEGLAGVEISVYDHISNTSPLIAQVTTGPDGTWRVAGLPAGTYRYRMVAAGHVSEWHVDASTKAASTGVVLATAEQVADLLDELTASP